MADREPAPGLPRGEPAGERDLGAERLRELNAEGEVARTPLRKEYAGPPITLLAQALGWTSEQRRQAQRAFERLPPAARERVARQILNAWRACHQADRGQ